MGQRLRLWTGVGIILASLLALQQARAYTPTISQNGLSVRWFSSVKLNLAGNPSNRSGLSSADVRDSVVRGLQRWQAASGGAANFDYWQGTDSPYFSANSDYNDYSNIYFSSAASGSGGVSPSILGLTQVWYNTDTGEILQADIMLNDRNFRFTTNPTDTSGSGGESPSFSNGLFNVFLDNVVTHELGHAFGLSHSGGLQSTMLFVESPEQAHLGCDDQLGIQSVYGGGVNASRGAITGVVISDGGAPVFGAHVLAISQTRGTVLASAVTNPSGRYTISALEAGTYYLMVEPFFGGAQTLPSYYSGINTAMCGYGRSFARSFLTQGSAYALAPVRVAAGTSVEASVFRVSCSSEVAGTAQTMTAVLDGSTGARGFGVSEVFSDGYFKSYPLTAISGSLVVHALSYSLFSPAVVELRLLDASGYEVAGVTTRSAYLGDSGFENYDFVLQTGALPWGNYTLQLLRVGTLTSEHYPSGSAMLDSVPFAVITGALNASITGGIPTGERCRMSESFGAYQSPSGTPVPSKGRQEPDSTGFCGSIRQFGDKTGKDVGMGPPSAGAVAGWFLPWALMAGLALGFRTRERARSQLI